MHVRCNIEAEQTKNPVENSKQILWFSSCSFQLARGGRGGGAENGPS